MRILVVSGSRSSTIDIENALRTAGHVVTLAEDREDGIELARDYDYDIVALDVDTLGDDLRALRVSGVVTPVIVLSSSTDVDARIAAFRQGADDFLVKPYHVEEMLARVGAIVRRAKGHAQPAIRIGDLVVDVDAKVASVGANRLALTGKEYAMLELLAMRKGSTLTKEMFLDHLYGGMDEPELKIIDVFMCKLRKKIAVETSDSYIETVWGRGYVLNVPMAVAKAA